MGKDDSGPAGDGQTRLDSTDQTLSDGESVTARKLQVIESCKEEERLSGTACAPDSNAQPCRETAAGSNLSVSMSPPSPTHATDKVTEQQTATPSDMSTENSPDAMQIPDNEPSDNHPGPLSNAVSSLASIQETSSTASASTKQTPQECDPVSKLSSSEQDKEKTISHETQNLSESPEDNENPERRTSTEQNKREDGQGQRHHVDEPNTEQTEPSLDPCPVTRKTAKNTEVLVLDHLFF